MNAVFQCPRCNTPLGTPDDPRPEPMPPCRNCGWTRMPPNGNRFSPGRLGIAFLMLALGLGAGWLVGHSLLLVLFVLVAAGPVATVGIARLFAGDWLLFPAAYAAGLLLGMTFLNDGQTLSTGSRPLILAVGLGSLLLAWLVGWLRHTD